MIRFTVPGRPVPWARAGTNGARHFTPKKQTQQMKFVRLAFKQAGGTKLQGPIEATVEAVYKLPDKWVRADGSVKDGAPVYFSGPPDADNLFKLVGDALSKTAYDDDAQIVRQHSVKYYGPPGDPGRTIVHLREIRDIGLGPSE